MVINKCRIFTIIDLVNADRGFCDVLVDGIVIKGESREVRGRADIEHEVWVESLDVASIGLENLAMSHDNKVTIGLVDKFGDDELYASLELFIGFRIGKVCFGSIIGGRDALGVQIDGMLPPGLILG